MQDLDTQLTECQEDGEQEPTLRELMDQEDEFMKGIPRLNIGALFMPPIWGPGHGIWITILYYPIWVFADNEFYSAFSNPQPLSIILSVIIFITLSVITIGFAILSQPKAAHRAFDRGKTKEEFLRAERKWAIFSVVLGVAFIVLATWYNLCIRPGI